MELDNKSSQMNRRFYVLVINKQEGESIVRDAMDEFKEIFFKCFCL